MFPLRSGRNFRAAGPNRIPWLSCTAISGSIFGTTRKRGERLTTGLVAREVTRTVMSRTEGQAEPIEPLAESDAQPPLSLMAAGVSEACIRPEEGYLLGERGV
jgi:hypothetical protein